MSVPHTQLRFIVALSLVGDAVTGTVACEGGPAVAFWGWLELLALLEPPQSLGLATNRTREGNGDPTGATAHVANSPPGAG